MARARKTKTEESLENEPFANKDLFADMYPKEEDIFDKIAIKKKRGRKKQLVN